MKFVFDECLSDKIPKALAIMGESTCSCLDEWSPGTPDEKWIPVAANSGWCVVTSDRLRPHERIALMQNKGRIFLLGVKNLIVWEQFRLIVGQWDKIKKEARKRKPPFIIRVPKRGKLQEVVV